MRRRTSVRLAWVAIAVLQLVLPGATAWADARLERESASPRAAVHIEQTGGSHCPRVHPTDCALCQHLATPLARVAPVRALFVAAPCVRVGAIDRARPPHATPRALPQPRAPPLS